ncbi:response regulator [Candidatus Nitronereus thalassa]|uniref:Response regulator n=1 Tax=Candidatus Nitronereus thalassa TaxID=3020898 RepID=A0ABU3K9R8_9BACT|nr:response regulator [Candidatus Nitronereus thalassa]MDT7043131.1 response regulator [Candidatus Nitronereus thalassa]
MSLLVSQPILLVEDSPEDYEITQRSLKSAGFSNRIQHCTDGDEALEYLVQCKTFEGNEAALYPGIILLDLNLPGTDGREVLAEIKADEVFTLIPVVVLSTSKDDRDIEACYALGANGYISKSLSAKEFLQAMIRLKEEWLDLGFSQKVGELP